MESKEFCTKKSHTLFSDKVLLGLLLQHRGVRPKKFPLLALSLTGKKVCSLYEVRVELWLGSDQRGGLGICPPVRWWHVQGHAQYPAFAPNCLLMLQAPQKWRLGVFAVFVSLRSRNCPSCLLRQLFLVPHSSFVFCCSRRDVFRCKHRALEQRVPVPAYLIPHKILHTLFWNGKGPKFSSSETSSSWTEAADPSLPERCRSPLLTVPSTYRDQGHSTGMGWIPWVIMSLISNCRSLKNTHLTNSFNEQGLKRRTTTVAFKRPRNGRNQVNFGLS